MISIMKMIDIMKKYNTMIGMDTMKMNMSMKNTIIHLHTKTKKKKEPPMLLVKERCIIL